MSNSNALREAASGRKVEESPAVKFGNFLEKLKPQLANALPKHLNADRMARLALTAFSTSRDMQACSPTSIAGSIMTAAQLGLEPGVNGQGYLIPYKGICTFVPGWKGLVDLVARSGRATVWTGAVRPGDDFAYQLGDAPFCRHTPRDAGDDEQFTHVYAIGRVRDAQMPVIEVWTRAKVERHLKQFNKVGGKHYAKASENNFEMYGRKVALLQVLKYMPTSVELANAMDVSAAGDAGRSAQIVDGIVIDADTGEITGGADQHGDAPTFDLAAFAARAERADADALAVMLDDLREVPASADRDAAEKIARERLASLQGGA